MLLFSDIYNQCSLKEQVVSFIVKHFKEMRKEDSWKMFRKNNLELAVQVLELAVEEAITKN